MSLSAHATCGMRGGLISNGIMGAEGNTDCLN